MHLLSSGTPLCIPAWPPAATITGGISWRWSDTLRCLTHPKVFRTQLDVHVWAAELSHYPWYQREMRSPGALPKAENSIWWARELCLGQVLVSPHAPGECGHPDLPVTLWVIGGTFLVKAFPGHLLFFHLHYSILHRGQRMSDWNSMSWNILIARKWQILRCWIGLYITLRPFPLSWNIINHRHLFSAILYFGWKLPGFLKNHYWAFHNSHK